MFKIYKSKTQKSYGIIEVAPPSRVWILAAGVSTEVKRSDVIVQNGEFITLESTEQGAKAYVEMCLLMED